MIGKVEGEKGGDRGRWRGSGEERGGRVVYTKRRRRGIQYTCCSIYTVSVYTVYSIFMSNKLSGVIDTEDSKIFL